MKELGPIVSAAVVGPKSRNIAAEESSSEMINQNGLQSQWESQVGAKKTEVKNRYQQKRELHDK